MARTSTGVLLELNAVSDIPAEWERSDGCWMRVSCVRSRVLWTTHNACGTNSTGQSEGAAWVDVILPPRLHCS